MNANRPILPILPLKLVAMAMSFDRSNNKGKLNNLRPFGENLAKINSVDSAVMG